MDTLLRGTADFLKESLMKSQTITDSVVAVLGSFDHRLSSLETTIRPSQIRTHSILKAHNNIDKALKVADVILTKVVVSSQVEAIILRGPQENLESYYEAIDQLRNNIKLYNSNTNLKSSDEMLNRSKELLAKAISNLEDEFKKLLSSYSKPVERDRLIECVPSAQRPLPASSKCLSDENDTTVNTPPDLIPPRVLPLLHDLAQQIIQAGRHQQLIKIYRDTRSSVLEKSLLDLGVEKMDIDIILEMPSEDLQGKIDYWIRFMRIAVKFLFAGERIVCDQIFEGPASLRDQCFAEVTSSSVWVLLDFGQAVAISKRYPERLFKFLEMYEIMQELHPEIETLFKGSPSNEIRETAMGLTKQLAQTVQDTLRDFGDQIEKDARKIAVFDGSVHSISSYVINYIKYLFDFQKTWKQIFQELGVGSEKNTSQLASVIMRLLQALQINMEVKSKQYKDPALTHLFLMNNIQYMIRSMQSCEAKDILGDDWVQRHKRLVQQHASQYKRNAWTRILQCLSIQGMKPGSGSGSGKSSDFSRSLVKERFEMFNAQFEELHQRQSQWKVPDPELRDSLRLAVAEILLPAYRSMLKNVGDIIQSVKNPHKYIRYTPEDLERMLGEFFEGITVS